ncbi:MAG: right-handed parallel beta-helix repeat-containing protein [Gammaproteobacteria bacterium]
MIPARRTALAGTLLALIAANPAAARVWQVGPTREHGAPSAVARLVQDGDTVEIDAGTYPRDVAIWTASRLTLRAVGGRATLDATDTKLPQRKAIWVIRGNDVRVEGIEFENARSPDRNGAGIRAEGQGLTVSRCFFHDNESGLLAGQIAGSDIVVEHSEFARNGHRNGQAHSIYVGTIRSFTLRFSHVHHAVVGSQVKSRAQVSRILYNRIMDEADGQGNYNIDLSNGGRAFVIGNLIQQGRRSENSNMIAFAPEGADNSVQELYVVHNTLVNDMPRGRFVMNRAEVPAVIYNNLFIGAGEVTEGPALLRGNVLAQERGWRRVVMGWFGDESTFGGVPGSGANRVVESPGVRGLMRYDYRLQPDSPAIDAGVDPGDVDGQALAPDREYQHPLDGRPRLRRGAPDAGAFEFDPGAATARDRAR